MNANIRRLTKIVHWQIYNEKTYEQKKEDKFQREDCDLFFLIALLRKSSNAIGDNG